MNGQKTVAHDGRRCPDCDSHGQIVEFRTRETPPNSQERVKSRVYDCEECETEWVKYD